MIETYTKATKTLFITLLILFPTSRAFQTPTVDPRKVLDRVASLQPPVALSVTGVTSSSALTGLSSFDSFEGNSMIQSHVLTELSHLGLDLASFMGSSMVLLQVAAILGRLCTVAADYLPDHTILPDELIFQGFMLALSGLGLARAGLLPALAASAPSISLKDGKLFRLLRSTGLTWNHYKALLASALDWEVRQPGESFTHDPSYVYILYDGTMELVKNQEHHKVTASPKSLSWLSVIGEQRLWNTQAAVDTPQTILPQSPCTFCRLHIDNLQLLTESDASLDRAMRNFVFSSMNSKLEFFEWEQHRA